MSCRDDKRRARLNMIHRVLRQIPHKAPKHEKVELPKRQKRGDYAEPDHPYKVTADIAGDAVAEKD